MKLAVLGWWLTLMQSVEETVPGVRSGAMATSKPSERGRTGNAYLSWPPKVVDVQDLGIIKDSNGRTYTRDGGTSSRAPSGQVVFQFGDTFANDDKGMFIAGTQSTLAVVEDPRSRPTIAHYTNLNRDGSVKAVPEILPNVEMPNTGRDGWRTTLWCTGGLVWDPSGEKDGNVTGYTFYRRADFKIDGDMGSERFHHTGPAEVTLNTRSNEVTTKRHPEVDEMFKQNEPKIGSFASYVADDGYTYLWGHGVGSSNEVVLGRVQFASILNRSAYEFWDGNSFQPSIENIKPVFGGWQHATIWKSDLFQPGTGRDWVFIGCSSFADSTIYMMTAPNPWGPFSEPQKLEIDASPSKEPMRAIFTYCMYAHPWAFDERNGELMITWCEGGLLGHVRVVKATFQQESNGQPVQPALQKPVMTDVGQSHGSKRDEVIGEGKKFLKGLFKK